MPDFNIQAKVNAYVQAHPEYRMSTQDVVISVMKEEGLLTDAELEQLKNTNVWSFRYSPSSDGMAVGLNLEHGTTVNNQPPIKVPLMPTPEGTLSNDEIINKLQKLKTNLNRNNANEIVPLINKNNVIDIIKTYQQVNGTSIFEDLLKDIPARQADRDIIAKIMEAFLTALKEKGEKLELSDSSIQNILLGQRTENTNTDDNTTEDNTSGSTRRRRDFGEIASVPIQRDGALVNPANISPSVIMSGMQIDVVKSFKVLMETALRASNKNFYKTVEKYFDTYINTIETNINTRRIADSQPLSVHKENVTSGYSLSLDVAQDNLDYQLEHNGVSGWIANYIAYAWNSDNIASRVQGDINTARSYIEQLNKCKTRQEFNRKFKEIFGIDYNPYNMDVYTALRKQYQEAYQANLTERMFLSGFSEVLNNEKLEDKIVHVPTNRSIGESAHDQLIETRQQKYNRYVEQYNKYLSSLPNGGTFEEELTTAGLKDATLDEKYEFLRTMLTFRYSLHHADTVRICAGRDFETIQEEYNNVYEKAFGNNEIMHRVDEYNLSQQKGAQYVKMTAVAGACIVAGAMTAGAGSLPILGGLTTAESLTVAAIGGLTSMTLEIADQTTNIFYQALKSDDSFGKAFEEAFVKEADLGKALTTGVMTAGTIIAFSIAGKPVQMLVNKLIPIPSVADGAAISEVFSAMRAQSVAMSAANLVMMEGTEYIMTGEITWEGAVFAIVVTAAGQILSLQKIGTMEQAAIEQARPGFKDAKQLLGLDKLEDSQITEQLLKKIKYGASRELRTDVEMSAREGLSTLKIDVAIDGKPVTINVNLQNVDIGQINSAIDIVSKYTIYAEPVVPKAAAANNTASGDVVSEGQRLVSQSDWNRWTSNADDIIRPANLAVTEGQPVVSDGREPYVSPETEIKPIGLTDDIMTNTSEASGIKSTGKLTIKESFSVAKLNAKLALKPDITKEARKLVIEVYKEAIKGDNIAHFWNDYERMASWLSEKPEIMELAKCLAEDTTFPNKYIYEVLDFEMDAWKEGDNLDLVIDLYRNLDEDLFLDDIKNRYILIKLKQKLSPEMHQLIKDIINDNSVSSVIRYDLVNTTQSLNRSYYDDPQQIILTYRAFMRLFTRVDEIPAKYMPTAKAIMDITSEKAIKSIDAIIQEIQSGVIYVDKWIAILAGHHTLEYKIISDEQYSRLVSIENKMSDEERYAELLKTLMNVREELLAYKEGREPNIQPVTTAVTEGQPVVSDGREPYVSPETDIHSIELNDDVMANTNGVSDTSDEFQRMQSVKATDADLRAMHAIDLEAFEATDPVPRSFESYKAQLEEDGLESYVIKDSEGKIVGYYQIEPVKDGELYINSIAVPQALRNTRTSYAVIKLIQEEITAFATEKGVERVTLHVDSGNEPLVKMYKKFGFEVVGTEADYYENGNDAYLMEVKVKGEAALAPEGTVKSIRDLIREVEVSDSLYEDNEYNRALANSSDDELCGILFEYLKKVGYIKPEQMDWTWERFKIEKPDDIEDTMELIASGRELFTYFLQRDSHGVFKYASEYCLSVLNAALNEEDMEVSARIKMAHVLFTFEPLISGIRNGSITKEQALESGISDAVYELIKLCKDDNMFDCMIDGIANYSDEEIGMLIDIYNQTGCDNVSKILHGIKYLDTPEKLELYKKLLEIDIDIAFWLNRVMEKYDVPGVAERLQRIVDEFGAKQEDSEIVIVGDRAADKVRALGYILEELDTNYEMKIALLKDSRFEPDEIRSFMSRDHFKERIFDTGIIWQPEIDASTISDLCYKSDTDFAMFLDISQRTDLSLKQLCKVGWHVGRIVQYGLYDVVRGRSVEEIKRLVSCNNLENMAPLLEAAGAGNVSIDQAITICSMYDVSDEGIQKIVERGLLPYADKVNNWTLKALINIPIEDLKKLKEFGVIEKLGQKESYYASSLSIMAYNLNENNCKIADMMLAKFPEGRIDYAAALSYADQIGALTKNPSRIETFIEIMSLDLESIIEGRVSLDEIYEIGFDKVLSIANDPVLAEQGKTPLNLSEVKKLYRQYISQDLAFDPQRAREFDVVKELLYGSETTEQGKRLTVFECIEFAKLYFEQSNNPRILEYAKKVSIIINRDNLADIPRHDWESFVNLTEEQYQAAKRYFYIEAREARQYDLDDIIDIVTASPAVRARFDALQSIRVSDVGDKLTYLAKFNDEEFENYKQLYTEYEFIPKEKEYYSPQIFNKTRRLFEIWKDKKGIPSCPSGVDLEFMKFISYATGSDVEYNRVIRLFEKGMDMDKVSIFVKYPNDVMENMHSELVKDAFAKRDILKTGAGELSDSEIESTFDDINVIRALDVLGKTNLEAAFPMMIEEFREFCKNVANLRLSKDNYDLLMRKINPTATKEYFNILDEISQMKQRLDALVGEEGREAIKGIDIEIAKIDTRLSELRQQAADIKITQGETSDAFKEISRQIAILTKEGKALKGQKQAIYFNCPNQGEVRKLFSEISAKSKQIREFLNGQENISPQEIVNKMRVIIGMERICTHVEMTTLIELLKPSSPENDAAWNDFVNRKIFEKIGVEYSEELSQKLDLVSSKYISQMFVSSSEFYNNMARLVNIVSENIDKPIEEIFDAVEYNIRTREILKDLGIDYDRYTKVDKDSFVSVRVELSADKIRQTAVQNLEREFNDPLFERIPQEVKDRIFGALKEIGVTFEMGHVDKFVGDGFSAGQSDFYMFMKDGKHITADDLPKIFSEIKKAMNSDEFWTTENSDRDIETARGTLYSHIMHDRKADIERVKELKGDTVSELEVRKTDMYDVKKALGLGNDAQCCTALGRNFNEWSAPNYIMTKAIGAIEVTDKGNFVGNTMIYFAYVDGELALVLDNIEMKTLYHNNDAIRDAIMEYAAKICEEVGRPDMHIYAGPNRHKLHMGIYKKESHSMEMIGDSGENQVYVDHDARRHYIGRGEVVQIDMYKIR